MRITGLSTAHIKVLLDWEQEGYTGVMTFNFDLVKERGHWMIAAIVY